MGIPIDCPESGTVLNGDFYNDWWWGKDPMWQIRNGSADAIWLAYSVHINLYQFLPLCKDEFYIIDFDVLEANCPGNSNLRVRLGGGGGNTSPAIKTIGHKRVVLQYNEKGEWLLFYIESTSSFPGNIKIDNVEMSRLQTFISCGQGLFPYPDGVYGHLDLGDGKYNFKYVSKSDHSRIWVAFDINVF